MSNQANPGSVMHPALERLLGVLELEPAGERTWEARQPDFETEHLFGGQVLAQGLVAAHRESEEGACHSLHAYFLKRGTTQEPIRFEVMQLRRSRAFRTYQVMAIQSIGPILQMTLSYHDAEPGPSHQIPMDEVGPPQGEAYERALLQVMTPGGWDDHTAFELPVEIRSVGDLGLFSTEVNPPKARCWMRVRGELPDAPVLHQCLFAYASDYAIFTPAVNPHPAPITAFQSASLDHAIWFHRSFRMDEWTLFELDSPVATAARGIARGLLYSRDGSLVASCVQEGLLRPLTGAARIS
jgi:acyl-CoA thioesterase-2